MSATEAESFDTVLLNTFVIRKKRCRVYFHRGTLTWESEGAQYARRTLPLSDVIAVHYVHLPDRTHCCPSAADLPDTNHADDKPVGEVTSATTPKHTSFILHFAVRGAKNKWKHETVTMEHTDPRQVASWVKTIRNYLGGLKDRPKRLLLFVNPYGGKKKGLRIYEKHVKPLFVVAGIEANVIITERQNHARDTLLGCSFDNVDGVVCIGGDGTFSEIFNGLILRAARERGVDYNNPEAGLPKPSLRVGIIPGGSTDTMAYCFHGTTDIPTAVLYIILGDSTGLDICSIHNNATLLRYYSSVISYGFLGDVVRDSEKFRWMGPKRYEFSGFKKFMANNGYEGEVTLLSDICSPSSGPKCLENCARCQAHSVNKLNKDAQSEGEWKTFRGKFFMINGANVSCACSRSPNGLSPYCHLGDGCVDVLIIKHTNMLNNLRLLLRMSSKEKNVLDLPFVEVHRAREFTFQAFPSQLSQPDLPPLSVIPGVSVWNCDGEVQKETDIRIRVHCQLLQVFTRRSQETNDEASCRVCSF